MAQQSMSEFVRTLEKIGQLKRITTETRADELPSIIGVQSRDRRACGEGEGLRISIPGRRL